MPTAVAGDIAHGRATSKQSFAATDTNPATAAPSLSTTETSTVGSSTTSDSGIENSGLANVELRGTRRSQLAMPKHRDSVKGKLQLPKPRKDGKSAYLRQLILTSAPLMAADLLVLLFATYVTSLLGLQWLNPEDITSKASAWLPPVAMGLLLLNAVRGLYPGTCLGLVDEIRRLSLSITIVALVTVSGLRTSSSLFWDRLSFLLVAYVICMFLAPVVRSFVRGKLAKTSWWGFPTLVCGNDSAVFGVCQWLTANQRLGLRPVGVVADPDTLELDSEAPWYAGPWSEARNLAERHHAYWAVLVESTGSNNDVTSVVEEHLGNIPQVYVVSELTGMPDPWDRHRMDEGLSGFMIEQHLLLPMQQMVKRVMDLIIVTIAGLCFLPVFLGLAIAVKLTSQGPIFYGHKRIGKGNSRFHAWKFRTMVMGADGMIEKHLSKHPELRAEWERDHKLKNDPRVTPLGKFMRKWSIDELPQLWNVFLGEMSTVGPRPIVDDEIPKYGTHYETFCSVLPGLTGLWQVCGRNDTTYDERVQLDIYYIHHWSPWLDLYLLCRTVGTVLFTKGAY